METRLVHPDKKAVGILTAGHIVSDVYGGFITPLMPLLAAKLSISLGIVGLLLSISNLTSSLLQPVFGYFSDLMSRRIFIICGLLFSAVFISFSGYANSFWTLGLILVFGSMGVGLFHPQATSLAGHFSGREINHLMGIFTACGTIGFALGPLLSSFLVENFGLHSTIFAVIPGLVIIYVIYKYLPKAPVKAKGTGFKEISVTLVRLKRILLPLCSISIIRSLSVVSFTVFMPFVWERHHFSVLIIGILIALFSIFGGISSYLGGKLSKSVGERPLLIFSMLPAIPCLFGALHLIDYSPIFSFISFLIAGFLLTVSMTINFVIAQKAAPENMGMISGIIGGFSWGLAGLMLTPIGFLATHFGIEKVLTVIAFAPILGSIAAIFLPKKYN